MFPMSFGGLSTRCFGAAIRMAIDDATLFQIHGEYALPPDAGPHWRAAHQAGIDVSLIEAALAMTPEQRLAWHQRVTDLLLEVQAAGNIHAAK